MTESPTTSDAPPSPRQIVEALLFVGGSPLTAERAGEIVRNLGPDQLRQIIDGLNRDYRRQGRPYAIQSTSHGYVLSLRPRYKPVVEKLYGGVREARLSTAAIDVLSLVAYRQPVGKAEVDAARGTDSGSILRQLVRLGLIAVQHRAEAGTREVRYGTTPRFLQLFGLTSLDELPRLGDTEQA